MKITREMVEAELKDFDAGSALGKAVIVEMVHKVLAEVESTKPPKPVDVNTLVMYASGVVADFANGKSDTGSILLACLTDLYHATLGADDGEA